jgi:glycosyltransferase involved in cell wall biosynthesis
MGEYARSLAIARACIQEWPQAQLHFVVSRQAPYAASVPFPATLLESSPTFHKQAVIALMESFRPTIVVFDNAGRSAQLRAARRGGARVVYISARARQRRKAFRWRWLKLIDEHWIAYPEFIAGSLGFVERFKLKLRPEVTIRFLDVILSRGQTAVNIPPLFAPHTFLLMVPGGGTGHPRARDAVAQFLAAAGALAAQGIATLCVGVGDVASERVGCVDPNLKRVPSLPQAELAQLLRDAKLVVANGGSTLLQAIACGAACIAVPIADDQAQRIRHCVQAGVALAAPLDADAITAAAARLWNDEPQRQGLAQHASRLRLADGIEVALTGLRRLIGDTADTADAAETAVL